MNRNRYLSHATYAGAGAAGCLAVVGTVTLLMGYNLAFVVDALFVLAIGLFAVTAILTRPSVSRRRTIQKTTDSDDDATTDRQPPQERGREREPSRTRDPSVQFTTGIRAGLVAVTLFCISFLVQYVLLS